MTEATVSFAGNLTDGQACDRTTLVAADPSQLPATGHGAGPKYGVCPSSSLQEVV
jgi:hypothetical protein